MIEYWEDVWMSWKPTKEVIKNIKDWVNYLDCLKPYYYEKNT